MKLRHRLRPALLALGSYYGMHNVSVLLLSSTYTTLIALFCAVGSMGPLILFTADRDRGVLEYLMGVGANPSTFFASTTLSALVLVTMIRIPLVALSAALIYFLNGSIPYLYLYDLAYFSISASYVSVSLEAIAGMTWSALTRRRAGMNTPIGVAPLIGLIPVLIVFYAQFLVLARLIPALSLTVTGAFAACLVLVNDHLIRQGRGREVPPRWVREIGGRFPVIRQVGFFRLLRQRGPSRR
ncbi:MAG: hypothetical protein RAK25_02880 [TACK group archaeon]|nr:hypothetical protein [TACK group archaeon]